MSNLDGTEQTPKGFQTQSEAPSRSRDLALLVCAAALQLKKDKALSVASPAELALHTRHRPSEVQQGIASAMQFGWLSPRGERFALTATGIYMAKRALNLPR